MFFPTILSLAVVFAAGAAADNKQDLGSVLAGEKNLTKFSDLLKKYPEVLLELPSEKGVTIIAPSNSAIDNIPYTALNDIWDTEKKDKTIPILQYHILQGAVSTTSLNEGPTYFETTRLTSPAFTNVTSGQNILFNKQGDSIILTSGQGTRCTLNQRDISFSGGLIQVVDNLLVPPTQIDKTAEAFQAKSFLGSLYAAKMMPDIAYRKNITIFAPYDDAYKVVGGTLQGLDAETLARVMSYHVIPDQVLASSNLTNGTTYATLSPGKGDKAFSSVTIRQDGNNIYVNAAQIIQPNILIANGVMHLVANVLNPDKEDTIPVADSGTQLPAFALSTVSGAFTSALPCMTDCPGATTSDAPDATRGPTRSSAHFSSTSRGGGPLCTAHVVGAAAVGLIGLGARMAWI